MEDENVTLPCTTVSGQPGMQLCINGTFDDSCAPVDPSRDEVCDGIDNNMNGQIDENTDELCTVDCHEGRRLCVDGILLDCSAEPQSEETCNGIDDDCDDLVDEGEPCIAAEVCEDGTCLIACQRGECPADFECQEDNFCHPLPCVPSCTPEQVCKQQACFDGCSLDRDCPSGYICEGKLCVQDIITQPFSDDDSGITENPGPTDSGGVHPILEDPNAKESPHSSGFKCTGNPGYNSPVGSAIALLFIILAIRAKQN